MKGNIKKLAVLMVITVISPFIMVAMASADDHNGKKAIHGEYAMMSSGSCLFSSGGFNANYTPIGASWAGSNIATGIWTFKRNGKGTMQQGTQLSLTLPPSTIPPTSASSLEFSFDFTYKVTDDGTVTVDVVPGTLKAEYVTGPLAGVTFTYGFSMFGMVSEDYKTITLASGNDVQQIKLSNNMTVYSICNLARVLIRLGE